MNDKERFPCAGLGLSHINHEVLLAGWVDTLRDHGELLFIHLRDRSGVVHFSPEFADQDLCKTASTLRNEFCVALRGRVRNRAPGAENPKLIKKIMTKRLAT